MKFPIAFTAALLSARARSSPICAPDSCTALLHISRACGHIRNTHPSHFALDCICNSRGFSAAIGACVPCVAGGLDPAIEWRRVCAMDESWYDESSVSASGGGGGGVARVLELAGARAGGG